VLAAINDLGCVTIDSQEGKSKTERAYVDGFMSRPHAIAFVDSFNMRTNMVALALLPSGAAAGAMARPRHFRSAVVVTRDTGSRGGAAAAAVTRLPLYPDPEEYMFLKTRKSYALVNPAW
jgi:hypothetical protein